MTFMETRYKIVENIKDINQISSSIGLNIMFPSKIDISDYKSMAFVFMEWE